MRGQVDDNGVVLAGGRRLGWDQVYYVDWTARDARLATAAGVVTVSRAEGDRAERAIAPWEAERDAWAREASEARRRDWAGLSRSSSATSRPGCGTLFAVGMLYALTGFVLVGAVASGDSELLAVLGCLGALCGGLAWLMARTQLGPTVTRDADGLKLGSWLQRRVRWADLRHSDDLPSPTNTDYSATRLVLQTRRGRIELPPGYSQEAELRDGLRQALADRAAAVRTGRRRGLFAPSRRRPGQGLWLDRDGLAVVGENSVKRHGWSRLGEPLWVARGAHLVVAGQRFKTNGYLRADRLAHAIDKHRAGNEPMVDANGQLRAEAIERWLGVKPGGALRCRLSPAAIWGVGLAMLALLGVLVWAIASGARVRNLGHVIGLSIALFLSMLGSARAVEADARGLSTRRGKKREYHAWSDIEALSEDRYEWSIRTTTGMVSLSRAARGADRVVGIIRRILALRERGAQLPTAAPTPEVALSLARDRGDQQAAERGLSVSEEE